jgi:Holliday junction DNA helicase RuvA
MITHLRGAVEKIAENSMVIDVNGVGYSLICSARTISDAQAQGDIVHIFTVLSVREDAWTLFGFSSEQERFWFNKLTSVQGVGGKVAIAILSALSGDDIYGAFLTGNKDIFTRADGVGAKLASRIISELKDKIVGKIDNIAVGSMPVTQSSGVVADVISAIVNLGYVRSDVLAAISALQPSSDTEFNSLFRAVLSKLSSGT